LLGRLQDIEQQLNQRMQHWIIGPDDQRKEVTQ